MRGQAGRRLIVIGSSNAGKTTLAIRLATYMCAPRIELDALHWEPGWVEADDEVFRERVLHAIAGDAWILEGNYIRQQQHVSWPAADTIVWLDLSLLTVMRRCALRSWRRWRTNELLYGNNREQFWEHLMLWDTNRSSFAHVLTTHNSRRRTFQQFASDPRWAHLTFIRLRSAAEIDRWLGSIAGDPIAPRTPETVGTSRASEQS